MIAPLFRKEAQRIVLWCNGSTTGFGSVCLGSNPGRTTQEVKEKKKSSIYDWWFLFLYTTSTVNYVAKHI